MNGHTSYADRLELFRKNDAERDALVAEVVRNYEELSLKYAEKCDDYCNEVESRRMWQSKATQSERALVEHRQASGSNAFALAVIDGDGALFNDFLWALGKDGGAEAAHQLHAEIKNHLKTTYPEAHVDDWSIVVQVVLNLQGLATKLQACGIVSNPNEVFAFGRAFGLAQPLFSFIDAGMGKERADHKIRETLRLFLPNAQCKHVFFGPCLDNGYLVVSISLKNHFPSTRVIEHQLTLSHKVLERYRRDYASRITLIETRAAEPGFVELGFNMVRFPSIFRSDNLPSKPSNTISPTPFAPPVRAISTSQMQPSTAPFVPKSASPAPSSDSASSSSWATVGKSGMTAKTLNIASKKAPVRKFILVNVHDERVDAELPRCDPGAEKRFGDRLKSSGKFCNNFHLTGKCQSGEYCDYNHGERLTPGEQLVLKHKARSRSCPGKEYCRDLGCTFGHHCKFGKACYMPDCWFDSSHGMDLQPAKRVYEDGSEEWISAYLEKLR
ncbi:hypothetical protein LTR37_015449 [Vermiconidia calcicola]|uniref:Uncharacterized protein n=1 Tax=Vermiconidia calcicola TaxID=1690605 RepID=A0ACC3MS68_9PEZI|nr:hypothetical protein LTR37_015449 [Vermiconidia calcicola]